MTAHTMMPAKDIDRLLILLELRHAKARLAVALNELEWGILTLSAGRINADAALVILEDAFDALWQQEAAA